MHVIPMCTYIPMYRPTTIHGIVCCCNLKKGGKNSIPADTIIILIATARVLPKATQRELFRLGAWPR